MPVIDQTGFQAALPREARIPPPGEMVITPETLERLKVPDEVLLKPESVNPFMAGQWVKLTDIISRPEIKAVSGDIPEYIHEEAFNAYPSTLSGGEQESLSSLSLKIQSEPMSDDELKREIDSHVQEMMRDHPEMAKEAGGPDLFDQMIMKEVQETEEEKKKFWEAFAAAKGNPEAVNLVLGWRYARQISKRLGKLVQAYGSQIDQKEKMLAEFDLANKRGPVTSADLAGFNAKVASQQTESSVLFNVIQKYTSDLERVAAETSRTNTEIAKPLQLMIQNMRT